MILEKIYDNLDVLIDDYEEPPEVQQTAASMVKTLGKDFMKYEHAVGAYAVSCEKNAFIRGFRFALSLLN